jgi:hypothetical protein
MRIPDDFDTAAAKVAGKNVELEDVIDPLARLNLRADKKGPNKAKEVLPTPAPEVTTKVRTNEE